MRTIMSSSSCAKCGCFGSSAGEKKPPEDAILITSAPARITSRTFCAHAVDAVTDARRGTPGTAASPALTPPLGSTSSLWPAVWLSIVTATCIRGPTSTPSRTAWRSPASAPPASRTT